MNARMCNISIVLAGAIIMLFTPSVASAHVTNEATIYDDIQYSEAKESIVILNGLSIISHRKGANLFYPQEQLTRKELAYWSGAFHQNNDQLTEEQTEQAALDQGLISSLEGEATFADIDQAYFEGQLSLNETERTKTMTKEQFAGFMSEHLADSIEGTTLYERSGIMEGPVGTIERIEAISQQRDGKTVQDYSITINGKQYGLTMHLKVLRGPVDMLLWEGKQIEESWLSEENGEQKIHILIGEANQFDQAAITIGHSESSGSHSPSSHNHSSQDAGSGSTLLNMILGGGLLLAVLAAWIFMRKPKKISRY